MKIRPEILAHYHRTTYGTGSDAGAYEGATFDEYAALQALRFPGMAPWTAADRAESVGRPDFAAMKDKLPPVPARPPVAFGLPEGEPVQAIERKPEVKLDEVPVNAKATVLMILQAKSVVGWSGLARWKGLCRLQCVTSSSPEVAPATVRAAFPDLYLVMCDAACTESAIRSATCENVDADVDAIVDLRVVLGHTGLTRLRLVAGFVLGLERLAAFKLRSLALDPVEIGAPLRAALHAQAGTLEELALGSHAAFGPEALPELPRLRRLRVPGTAAHREAWLAFASAHPEVFFDFEPPRSIMGTTKPVVVVAEQRAGIDVLSITKGKQTVLAIQGDFAGNRNDALEAEVRKTLGARARDVTWSSDPATFAARTSSIEWAQQIADAIAAAPARASKPAKLDAPVDGDGALSRATWGAAPKAAAKTAKAPAAKVAKPQGHFAEWTGNVAPKVIAESEQIVDAATGELAALGPKATAAKQRAVFTRAVERFNEVHAKHDEVFTTIEAEAIVERLRELAQGTKLDDAAALIDGKRTW